MLLGKFLLSFVTLDQVANLEFSMELARQNGRKKYLLRVRSSFLLRLGLVGEFLV